MGGLRGRDEGQIGLLVLRMTIIAILLILTTAAITAVSLARMRCSTPPTTRPRRRQRLRGRHLRDDGVGSAVPVSDASVQQAAADHLATLPPPNGVRQWGLSPGTGTPDGQTAVVVLTGHVPIPFASAITTRRPRCTVVSRARAPCAESRPHVGLTPRGCRLPQAIGTSARPWASVREVTDPAALQAQITEVGVQRRPSQLCGTTQGAGRHLVSVARPGRARPGHRHGRPHPDDLGPLVEMGRRRTTPKTLPRPSVSSSPSPRPSVSSRCGPCCRVSTTSARRSSRSARRGWRRNAAGFAEMFVAHVSRWASAWVCREGRGHLVCRGGKGLKSVTFEVNVPMPTGTSPRGAAPTAWCGSAPSTTRAAARPASPPSRSSCSSRGTDPRGHPRERTPRSTSSAPAAPAAERHTTTTPPFA